MILRTWAEDKSLLRCELRFADFAAAFDARVTGATDTELRLMADNRRSELTLRLRDDFTFAYNDMREPPSNKYVRMIVVFYPYIGDPADADIIVLGEMIEGS